ncbi:MAG: FAD-dependent oxidoreductase, partial [Kiritimatiellae bacterium]|nr:FAD-dependent oxidoreductase [Kiritimatiellia bacterium]
PCSAVFAAFGRTPDTALFDGQVALDPSGYIAADETCRTSVDGVFAAGDVRTKHLRQIVTACADGATAISFAEEWLNK